MKFEIMPADNKEKEHGSVILSLEVFILKKFILYFKLFNFTQAL
jgi:hypothetical protein